MNWRSTLAAAALLVAATALRAEAQTKAPARRGAQPKARVVSHGETMKDGFLVKDGKVLETRNAHTGALGAETTLVNGTKIGADGTVTLADGTTTTLREGDYMSLTGRMTTMAMKAEQDSLRQLQMNKMKGKKKK